jgi:hypothetical protein
VYGWGRGFFSPGEMALSSYLKAAVAVLTAPVKFFFEIDCTTEINGFLFTWVKYTMIFIS